jgi:hypothetical protein
MVTNMNTSSVLKIILKNDERPTPYASSPSFKKRNTNMGVHTSNG